MEQRITIPGYFYNYEVSNRGRIRKPGTQRVTGDGYYFLKPQSDKDGYLYIHLQKGNRKQQIKRIHRLVAELFIGDIEGKVVCHRDDNPKNNNIDNLFIGTQKDNVQDCKNKGRLNRLKGINHYNQKYVNRYNKILNMYNNGIRQIDISKILGIPYTSIKSIIQKSFKTN